MSAVRPEPPRLAGWCLRRLSRSEDRLSLEGDFDEEFEWRRGTRGAARARLWYWGQLAKSGPALISDAVYWRTTMFQNDLKIAFRNLMKNKVCSFVNIAGLAIGLACFLAIFLYVRFERSYDDYHRDGDRVYRVATAISGLNMPGNKNRFANISAPAAPAIKENFPQVEKAARVRRTPRVLVRYRDKLFYEYNLLSADQELLEILSIPVVRGDAAHLLVRPGTLAVTESMARRCFGEEDPVGKTIRAGGSDFEITGVVRDPPRNTHLKYSCLAALEFASIPWAKDSWTLTVFYTYLKVRRGTDVEGLENSINSSLKGSPGQLRGDWTYFLQPLRDIHLRSDLLYEAEPPGNPAYLRIFSVIAAFILLIAAVNFVNLATARSAARAKEVGLRKVVGARRRQLVRQFLGESVLLSALAAAIAFVLVWALLPLLSRLTGVDFRPADLLNLRTIAVAAALAGLTGLGAGMYPALLLSGFNPVLTLKGSFRTGLGKAALRRSLVVLQFVVAVVMIISTLLVRAQLSFMKNAKLGFAKEQKLVLPAKLSGESYRSIKGEFLSHPAVKGVTASSSVPGREDETRGVALRGRDFSGNVFTMMTVDDDFMTEYRLAVVAGEKLSKRTSGRAGKVCLINETGARILGFDRPEQAVGSSLHPGTKDLLEIVGILKDFHYRGLQRKIDPLLLVLPKTPVTSLAVLTLTLETRNLPETLKFVERKWKELKLGAIYSYRFLDEDFNRLYQTEERVAKVFGTFTALGLLIAFLGLFGLALLTSEQRTREIGIRKVLGAATSSIFVLLTKEFVRLVVLGIAIAWPIAYFAMRRWLQDFAYRTDIGWAPFAGAAAAAVALSLLTVSFQVLKSASADPARSIRYE